jgi:hypothetical protein
VAPLNASGRAAARRRGPPVPGRTRSTLRDAAGLVLLAAFLAVAFGDGLRFPFINDDYVFLDRTRAAPFASLWGFGHLVFQWYRPWSREFHYWLLQRLAGPNEPVFHAANLVLGLCVLATFASLVRREAGRAASAWALAAAAELAAWGLPLLWVAGVQDLWMMLWALLALRAWAADRRGWATLGYALALLSKETACVLPGVLLAWDVTVARRDLRSSLARIAPLAAVAVVWAGVHPHLGGRLWRHVAIESAPPEARVAAPLALLRALALVVNLDAWPRPEGSLAELARAAAAPVALLVLLAWVRWPNRRVDGEEGNPIALSFVGLCWAALGWAPLLLPGLGWHGYYGLFGALGLLFALAPWVSRRLAPALLLVALVGVLGVARARTPSLDWGEASYQRRAASMLQGLRADLLHLHPGVPRHARLWFAGVPDRVGFLAGDGPALRVWYRDSTLSGGFYSAWRPRAADGPQGIDYFFAYDTTRGWVEVHTGAENVARARAADRDWEENQRRLATALSDGGDWAGAATCYEKLAGEHPDDPTAAFRVAICRSQAGDSLQAAEWLARAARLPGAGAEILAAAHAARLIGR